MALTGVLKADFSEFQTAVSQAEIKLASFQTGAGKVEGALTRMTSSFSGTKLISDATLMTEAVDRIGGASKLTGNEMATVNLKVGEAIEKFRALGQSAPESMVKLHAETTKVPAAASSILSAIAPLAGAFGVAFSVGAVVNFGRAVLNDADALVKLSDKTGIAIEPIQRLKYAAEQSGNTFEQVAGAVSMMQKRISEGDKSAVGALNQLGISLSTFTAMEPDQQFLAIAREVAKIEDPMQRVKVATELFGRAGAELLPTLTSEIDKLAQQAVVMSERSTRAFEQFGDAANLAWSGVRVVATETVGTVIDAISRLGQSATAFATGDFGRIPAILADVESGLPKLPPPLDNVKRSTDGVSMSMGEMDRISRELTRTTQESITKQEAFKRTQDALFGRDIIERANGYVAALGGVENLTKLTDDKKKELKASVDKAIAAYAALGEKAPASLRAVADATNPAITAMFNLDEEVTKLHAKSLPPFSGLLDKVDRTLDALPASVAAFRSELVFTAETIETDTVPALEKMITKANAAVAAMGAASRPMGELTVTVGDVNPFTGAGKAGTDPRVWSYMQQGYTIGEAVSLSQGIPTNIGAAHGYWDAKGWHPGSRPHFPGRALGGPVSAGESYMVGERGPELFTPRTSGGITANGGGGVFNITVNTVAGDGQAIARLVERALTDAYRSKGGRM